MLNPTAPPLRTKKADMPYPPGVLAGGREVPTPYGNVRVYEWGPEDDKMLLIHGMSTPSIALGGIAHSLVKRGCRATLFDLFGRGYTYSPADLQETVVDTDTACSCLLAFILDRISVGQVRVGRVLNGWRHRCSLHLLLSAPGVFPHSARSLRTRAKRTHRHS